MRAALSALVLLVMIFGSDAAPAPPAAKFDNGVFRKTITTLSDVFKDLQLTEDQIQSLSKPKPEREQTLFHLGVEFCDAHEKDCKGSQESCKTKLDKCYEGVKICAAAESLCLDILKQEQSPVCERQRVVCHGLVKYNIH